MIISILFIVLILIACSAALFYLFCFFIPALKLKYDGINNSLASKNQFSMPDTAKDVTPDFTKIAFVKSSEEENPEQILYYKGERNCNLFHSIYGSEYKNSYNCIGFGDCVSKCPQTAIKIKNGVAVVTELCNGCGKCINYCPNHLISLVPSITAENTTSELKVWKKFYTIFKKLFKGNIY